MTDRMYNQMADIPTLTNFGVDEAIQYQLEQSKHVRFEPLDPSKVSKVVALKAICASEKVMAVAIRIRLVDWAVEQVEFGVTPVTFPYQPGLFAYCAAAAIFQAIMRLNPLGDVVIVEGHGVAHPRRFGLACFIGLSLNIPCLGCARSLLNGTVGFLHDEKGSYTLIMDQDEPIGVAYRSRKGCKPVYLSVGNRIDLASLISLCANWFKGFRLPEPLRLANYFLRLHFQKEF